MSPVKMSRHLNVNLGLTSYHMCTVLHKQLGLIEIVKEIPRRGAIEHVFGLKPEAAIGHPDWQKMLPNFMTSDLKAVSLRTFVEQLMKAAAAVDPSRLDPNDCLGWIPVRVDNKGRQKIAKLLSEALQGVAEVEAESREQLDLEPSQAINLIVGITSFEAGDRRSGADES